MELLAAGFNAHNQLKNNAANESSPKDQFAFARIATGDDIQVLFAGWSCTIYQIHNSIHVYGHVGATSPSINSPQIMTFPHATIQSTSKIRSIFGDHNGPFGLLTTTGQLYNFTNENSILTLRSPDPDTPTISHIALTNATQTSITFLQAPASHMIHLLTFSTYVQFLDWYNNPSASNPVSYAHAMLSGRAKSLVAGATAFALLTDEGEVYTWGDQRYSGCLARTPSAQYPASVPTLVDALGGIPIEQIDAGGWGFGAMSKESDLYIWGCEKPGANSGEDEGLKGILPSDGEEIKLVDIEGVESVKDFGIGNGHIVVISEDGSVWAQGDNRNGQLGLGDEVGGSVGEWRKVNGVGKKITKVTTGDLCTFLTRSSVEI